MASKVSSSVHVAMGIPTDNDPTDDFFIDEKAYVVSYNPTRHDPNWVSWNVNRDDLGHLKRKNDFRPDPKLPDIFYHVTPKDYAHEGYDRGHLCPSADREDSPDDNTLTFFMTNMLPQIHELNAGPWEDLEKYERNLANRPGAQIYITAGGVFDEHPSTIGHGVQVPKATYKIIVVLRDGQTAADVSEKTETIASVLPNKEGVGQHKWTEYVGSIEDIERQTGYEFLSIVPEGVRKTVEMRVAEVQ